AQGHHLTVEKERGRLQREQSPLAVAVLQDHGAGLEADHRAAEAGPGVFDHEVRLGVDLRDRLAPPPVPLEYVAVVAPHGLKTLSARAAGRLERHSHLAATTQLTR